MYMFIKLISVQYSGNLIGIVIIIIIIIIIIMSIIIHQ